MSLISNVSFVFDNFDPGIREYRLRSLGRWIATYGAAVEQRGGNGEAPQRAAEGEARGVVERPEEGSGVKPMSVRRDRDRQPGSLTPTQRIAEIHEHNQTLQNLIRKSSMVSNLQTFEPQSQFNQVEIRLNSSRWSIPEGSMVCLH